MKTKKEGKEIAWKEYKKIVVKAEKEYDKTENPAFKKYEKVIEEIKKAKENSEKTRRRIFG